VVPILWVLFTSLPLQQLTSDAYSDKEYIGLMDKFRENDMPLSVAVIDIDWHLINVPEEFGTGWTGYT
jgi:hypothetical protein